jgi:hypothetical protein
MTPFAPTDHCPSCGNIRPYHHPCPCGDPGGMPRTLPKAHKRWSKREKHLYGGASIRVMGETDHAGNLLCCFLSGPLAEANECRWMSWEELAATGQDASVRAETAPQATEGGKAASRAMCGAGVSVQGDSEREGDTAA